MSWLIIHLKNSKVKLWVQANPTKLARIIWAGLVIVGGIFIGCKVILEWPLMSAVPWKLDLGRLGASFGIYSVSLMLTASCWALIIRRLSGLKSFWLHLRIFCLTNLAQRLPTLLPYLTARTEAYISHEVSREITLTAMTVEIAVTLLGAALVAGSTLLLGFYPLQGDIAIVLAGLLFILALLIVFPRSFVIFVNFILTRLKRPYLAFDMRATHTLSWVGLYIIIWLNSGVLYYFLVSSISTVSPHELLFFIGISALSGLAGWLGQLLFFLPTAFIRQFAIVYLMNSHFPMPAAVAFALFSRVCVMVFELVWAGICFIFPKAKEQLLSVFAWVRTYSVCHVRDGQR